MDTGVSIGSLQDDHHASVRSMLQSNDLPFQDLNLHDIVMKVAIEANHNQVVGCAGLEIYEEFGLLRSFVIDQVFRGKNLGNDLLDSIETAAHQHKLKSLHLLTTTAAHYFQLRGFEAMDRSQTPTPIKKSSEFLGVCPSSATYMVKKL